MRRRPASPAIGCASGRGGSRAGCRPTAFICASLFALRELGLAGFLAFQGHFAGIIIAALVHPLSYALIIHDAASGRIFSPAETTFGHQLWLIAIFNLIAGYAASLALGFFALTGRGVWRLVPQLIFIPVYWLLISAAAYRAVYQLITAPHYWEKTEHGVTKMRRKNAKLRR